MPETILILDHGSQYTQLIARRVRELNVYCEILPYNKAQEGLGKPGIKGVILSGSPFSVHDNDPPLPQLNGSFGNLPVLGICFGAQFIAHSRGGKVVPSSIREYGRANLGKVAEGEVLTEGLSEGSQVWMSHGDTITELPSGFEVIASTADVAVAGYKVHGEPTFGVQFHPEVYHTTEGLKLLGNFVLQICGCQGDWTPDSFVESTVASLQAQLGNDHVVLALSGGVDSSVAAVLLDKAIGERLHCIFVDNGLLRKNEFEQVLEDYRHMGLNIKGVDAKEKFYAKLAGVTDPEEKRKAIGNTFIDVFEEEARALPEVRWLGQGTIYPDVIESVSVKGPSATIKSHHNVGGLPEKDGPESGGTLEGTVQG